MKRVLLALKLLAVAFSAQANSVERRIRALADDLAKKYMLTEESLVSKKSVTLVQVKNVSPLAEKNYVGQAVAERIKAAIQDSLVFTYVDRELLEEALEEIELSLSDITEGASVEVGRIEEVELLLTGSVLEQGEDFLVTLQLVDVETTTVAAVSKITLPKAQLIEAGSQYAFAYVMANGIGISLTASPAFFLVYPLQEQVRHGDKRFHGGAFNARLSYRLSRNWKVGLEVEGEFHDVFYDRRKFQDLQNVPTEGKTYAYGLAYIQDDGTIAAADPPPPPDPSTPGTTAYEIANISVSYSASQRPISISLPFSYVWTPGHRLSVSFGLGPTLQFMNVQQNYDSIPVLVGDAVAVRRKEITMWFTGLGAQGNVDVEYFFLPRLALNVGASFLYARLLPQSEREARCLTSGEYYYNRDDFSYEAFLLDPFLTTDGREIDESIFKTGYAKIYVGVSFYF